MNHVAIVLRVFVKINFHIFAITTEIVAGKVNKHNMFGVFFWVCLKRSRKFCIFLVIAGTLCSARYGVYIGFAVLNSAVRFGRRTENAISAEIKVKEVWRRIYASQRTI